MQGIPQGQNQQGGSQKPSTLSWTAPGTQHKPAAPQDNKPKPQTPPPPAQKPSVKGGEEKSNMTTYVGIFIAGLIVGGLLASVFTGQHGTPTVSTETSNTGTTTTTTTTNTTAGVDLTGSTLAGGLQGLTIASGQEAGATVAVSSISVQKPTWVIIYDNQGGVPGRALGAQLFFPVSQGGETSGTVSLVRSTLAGHSYLAGERIDNGDNTYVPADDHQVLDANGQALTVQFDTK